MEYDRCWLRYLRRTFDFFCPISFIFHNTFLFVPALLCFVMPDRCARLKVYQVSWRWEGGTGLEIAAAVGSCSPRHPERCCSNPSPSGENREPRTLQERRGERKIQRKVFLSHIEGIRHKQPAVEDSTSPQRLTLLLSSYSPSLFPVVSLQSTGTDASMRQSAALFRQQLHCVGYTCGFYGTTTHFVVIFNRLFVGISDNNSNKGWLIWSISRWNII